MLSRLKNESSVHCGFQLLPTGPSAWSATLTGGHSCPPSSRASFITGAPPGHSLACVCACMCTPLLPRGWAFPCGPGPCFLPGWCGATPGLGETCPVRLQCPRGLNVGKKVAARARSRTRGDVSAPGEEHLPSTVRGHHPHPSPRQDKGRPAARGDTFVSGRSSRAGAGAPPGWSSGNSEGARRSWGRQDGRASQGLVGPEGQTGSVRVRVRGPLLSGWRWFAVPGGSVVHLT